MRCYWCIVVCLLVGEANGRSRGESVFYLKEYHSFDRSLETAHGAPPAPIHVNAKAAITQVLIAAFREQRCGRTLFHLFDKAKRPHLLRVSLVDQVASKDSTCLQQYCDYYTGDKCPYKSQISVKYVDAAESKGPCYARGLGEALIDDDAEFCLQIDSHSLFIRDWDSEVQKEWYKANNEYAVLTTYVNNIDMLNQKTWKSKDDNWLPHICKTTTGQYGSIRNEQAEAAVGLKAPKLTMTWGAGFSYAKCHFEREVPNDSKLAHIFDGEEYSRFTRAWTRGYDSYTPSRNTVFHDYTPVKSSWEVTFKGDKEAEVQPSLKRLAMLWNLPKIHHFTKEEGEKFRASEPFGIGSCRSYAELEQFTDVRTSGPRYVPSQGTRCANLTWVPYDVEACHEESYRARLKEANWKRNRRNQRNRKRKPKKRRPIKDRHKKRKRGDRQDIRSNGNTRVVFWGVFALYLLAFLVLGLREARKSKDPDHLV